MESLDSAMEQRLGYHKAAISALLAGLWLVPSSAQAGDPLSVISRTWKNREANVSSLDCEWSARHTFGAKTLVYRDKDGKQFFLPPADLTVPAEYRFRLDGASKMRYEYTGSVAVEETRQFESRSYISITDGKEQKCYYGKDESRGEPRYAPLGFINKKARLPETPGIHLTPLLTLYRPSSPEVAPLLDFSKFSVKGERTIGGSECLLLENIQGGMAKCEMAIDMKRECVPVRLRQLMRNRSKPDGNWRTAWLVEIDYVKNPDGSWRPASWKSAIFKDSATVLEQMDAVVKRFEVNLQLPESDFHFEFPVGTLVRNRRTGERYILRDGGEKREVTQAEVEAWTPYTRLLATRSGEAVKPLAGSFPFWFVVSAAILLLLLAWLFYRRFLERKKGGFPAH